MDVESLSVPFSVSGTAVELHPEEKISMNSRADEEWGLALSTVQGVRYSSSGCVKFHPKEKLSKRSRVDVESLSATFRW